MEQMAKAQRDRMKRELEEKLRESGDLPPEEEVTTAKVGVDGDYGDTEPALFLENILVYQSYRGGKRLSRRFCWWLGGGRRSGGGRGDKISPKSAKKNRSVNTR